MANDFQMTAHRLVLTLISAWLLATAFAFAQTNVVVVGASGEYWGGANHLDLSGNEVFLSTGWNAEMMHWIYDVSNPTNPLPVGPMAQYGESVTASGKFAYVVNPPNVNIYDISNPTNAHAVGLLTNSGRVVVSGDFAYLAAGSAGLYVYDISNPTNAVVVGHSTNNYGGFASDIAVSSNYAYVANGTDGLRVFDVSNPSAPFAVGPSGLSAGAERITISGDHAYVGVGRTNFPDYGTTIYDITSHTNPVRGGHITWFWGEVSVSGNYLYIANGPIRIFDVSNFEQPIEAGFYFPGGVLYTDIKVRGGYAYASGDSAPLIVFWLGTQPPPQLKVSQSGPNTLVLSWPTPASAYAVQQNPDLKPAHWTTLTLPDAVVVIGSRNQVTVSKPAGTMFYRLVSQ